MVWNNRAYIFFDSTLSDTDKHSIASMFPDVNELAMFDTARPLFPEGNYLITTQLTDTMVDQLNSFSSITMYLNCTLDDALNDAGFELKPEVME